MPQYAEFDSTAPSPSPVIGWYDTDALVYPNLPPPQNLFQLTSEQWDAHITTPSNWAIDSGALVTYTAPPSLPTQAQTLLAQKIAAGIAITSTSVPAVNGTYALDQVSTNQIYQIGSFAKTFNIFPSGATTLEYPDISSNFHAFNVAVFIEFLLAVAALVAGLNTQASIMAQGGTPEWPSLSAALD